LQGPEPRHTPTSAGPAFNTAAAQREGWIVADAEPNTDGSPGVQLQRLDDPEDGPLQFPGDKEVWEHVVARARAGSDLHRQALALVDPFERCLIEATCGPV
ncbi:MAG: hypothetical protein INR65_06185, partial [Gluconacetobacter diazotrophicus]|nr:hypothetical protein [Gluconacetobacter diazotrophicus]